MTKEHCNDILVRAKIRTLKVGVSLLTMMNYAHDTM